MTRGQLLMGGFCLDQKDCSAVLDPCHHTYNMAPLTSPSGCVSCAYLAEKTLELEGRISTLYKIQEAEKLLDTIVFRPAQTDTNSGLEPDATTPTTAAEPWSRVGPRSRRERSSSLAPPRFSLHLENKYDILDLGCGVPACSRIRSRHSISCFSLAPQRTPLLPVSSHLLVRSSPDDFNSRRLHN
ncbi:hypothetical protein ABVT39_018767 [Epinephelus coioides]